jgi:hypothetical protein
MPTPSILVSAYTGSTCKHSTITQINIGLLLPCRSKHDLEPQMLQDCAPPTQQRIT